LEGLHSHTTTRELGKRKGKGNKFRFYRNGSGPATSLSNRNPRKADGGEEGLKKAMEVGANNLVETTKGGKGKKPESQKPYRAYRSTVVGGSVRVRKKVSCKKRRKNGVEYDRHIRDESLNGGRFPRQGGSSLGNRSQGNQHWRSSTGAKVWEKGKKGQGGGYHTMGAACTDCLGLTTRPERTSEAMERRSPSVNH